MALSFSNSLSHLPLLQQNRLFTCQFQLGLASIRCSTQPIDKSIGFLKTSKQLRKQCHPSPNHTTTCRYQAGQIGAGTETEERQRTNPKVDAYATGRNIRMSADKARRVVDQIRGRSYEEALMILELMPYRACATVLKLVFSAAANADHNKGLSKANLIISKAEVNEGPTMKRVRPQARGRAYAVRKRTCHITVGMSEIKSDA